MVTKTVDKIVLKTIVEAKLTTYIPSDGEYLAVKKTNGGVYIRIGDGVTAGGVDPLAHIMTILSSPDVNLDTLVEIVNYIKSVRTDLTNVAPAWSVITGKPTTLLGYGITDATPSSHIASVGSSHGIATTTVNGFMAAADKLKLDGVANGATNYTHPATHPASMIIQDATSRFVTDADKAAWNAKESAFDSLVATPIV